MRHHDRRHHPPRLPAERPTRRHRGGLGEPTDDGGVGGGWPGTATRSRSCTWPTCRRARPATPTWPPRSPTTSPRSCRPAGCGPTRPRAIDLLRTRSLGRARHAHRVGQVAGVPAAHRRGRVRSRSGPGTALLIFPTKALAQDQLRAFIDLGVPRMTAATYDGDCTPEERAWVRQQANVLLTNPEMLHHGLLPNHRRWATFLVAAPLRRHRRAPRAAGRVRLPHRPRAAPAGAPRRPLRRRPDVRVLLGHHRRARPPRLRAAAASPVTEVARRRLARGGAPRRAVGPDGARPCRARRRRRRHPVTVEAQPRSPRRWSRTGLRTLVFCRSRRGTELVAESLRATSRRRRPTRVRAYRVGLPARGAPRDRGRRSFGGRARRGRRHQRARARRRHRRPRCRRALRLPRHRRLDVAADRPGRSARVRLDRGRRRRRRPARPLGHGPPRRDALRAARAGGDQRRATRSSSTRTWPAPPTSSPLRRPATTATGASCSTTACAAASSTTG